MIYNFLNILYQNFFIFSNQDIYSISSITIFQNAFVYVGFGFVILVYTLSFILKLKACVFKRGPTLIKYAVSTNIVVESFSNIKGIKEQL